MLNFLKFNRSTTTLLVPRNKLRQWYALPTPVRKYGCSITLFSNKENCIETGLDKFSLQPNQENSKIVEQISNILQCSECEIHNLCLNHNHIFQLEPVELRERVKKLEFYGIDNETLKRNIQILSFNLHQLGVRLELLRKWKFKNLNNAVDFLQLPFMKLMKYTSITQKDFDILDGQNRITYFSLFVKCDEKQACDLFVKYSFLMSLNVEVLKTILSITKNIGVLTEDLLSDPWLFKYRPQFIEKRIEFLYEIDAREKCKVIKPWMLRCPLSTINRYFELKDENIAALGSYTNLKDLLSNELELSENEVEEMFTKHPPLAKISYSKAKEMIDFLRAEGFGSRMIYQVPRVLCHKQETLLARILELKKVNPKMMSLQNLCRNKKDYMAFLNKVQGSHRE